METKGTAEGAAWDTLVGGVDAVVGVPGDRRSAPWALRGPLREPGQRLLRALQAPLRPRLVVVGALYPVPLSTGVRGRLILRSSAKK